jgi:hypothetical protein
MLAHEEPSQLSMQCHFSPLFFVHSYRKTHAAAGHLIQAASPCLKSGTQAWPSP